MRRQVIKRLRHENEEVKTEQPEQPPPPNLFLDVKLQDRET
jgi:hypothetical protein